MRAWRQRSISALLACLMLSAPTSSAFADTTAPGSPTNVSLTPAEASMNVRWTAPTTLGDPTLTAYTATAFTAASGGTAVSSCTTPSSLTNCSIDGLTGGTTYFIGVTATNGTQTSAESTRVSGTVGVVPGAPRSVTVSRAANGAITVEWLAPSSTGGADISSYTASAYTSTSSSATAVATCTTTSLSCTIDGPSPSTTYYVAVRATNTIGTSTSSSRITAGPVSAPTVPQRVTVTRGNGFAQVKWVAPTSTGGSRITRYLAQAFHTLQGGDPIAACEPDPLTSLVCNVGPLPNGGTYYIDVTAFNANGASEASSPRIMVVTAAPPSAPREVVAVRVGAAVDVAWRTPEADGGLPITTYVASAYAAERGGTALATCTTNGPGCQITGLTGAPVYIDVVARTEAGSSPASSPRIRVRLIDRVDTPLAVAGSARPSGIAVSWLPPLSAGGSIVTSYRASAFTSPSGGIEAGHCELPVTQSAHYAGRGDRIGCTIKSLTPDVIYYLQVAATSEAGATVTAERSAVRVRVGKPLPPRAVAALPGRDHLEVVWSLPAGDGGLPITEYLVEGFTTQNGTKIAHTCRIPGDAQRTVFTCRLTDTRDFEPTWLQVTARTERGWGQPSARVAFESKPSVPTAPQRVQLQARQGGVSVTWERPYHDGGYPIYAYVATASDAKTGGRTLGTCRVFVKPAQARTETTPTRCAITGLADDTYVWVTVTAENTVGVGPASEAVAMTVVAGPPISSITTTS